MDNVGATIVVQFGEGVDSTKFVVVELDETLNLDSDGNEKSQFDPGDEAWFWMQHEQSIAPGTIECTSGMVVDCGIVRRSRSQELTFSGPDDQQTLSHFPAIAPDLTWYGNDGSPVSLDGRGIMVGGTTPCTCDAVIPIDVHLYRYVPPPMNLSEGKEWRSIVVFTMEDAKE